MGSEPRVFKSLLPPVPVVRSSIFTHLFEETFHAHSPSAPAYIDFGTGQTITREEVKRLSLHLAWGLRNTIHLPDPAHSQLPRVPSCSSPLRRGDTVMFVSPNSLSWPIALFGCVAAGLRVTFAAPSSTSRELSWQYLDSQPRAIFVAGHLVPVVNNMFTLVGAMEEEAKCRTWNMDMDKLLDVVRSDGETNASSDRRCSPIQTGKKTKNVDEHGISRLDELMRGDALKWGERFDGEEAEETVYICYSSGTTGRPKGIETSHKNVGTVLNTTQALWSGCEVEHDVYIAILPTYHIFGLAMLLHYPFMRGKPLVMMNQGFEPKTFCEAVEKYRVTSVCLVPPIILSLTRDPSLHRHNLSSITNITCGAAHLSVGLANKFLKQLSERGANAILIQGCGSTETTCPAQIVAPADSVRKFGSVGQLVPNIEARMMVEVEPGVYRDAGDKEDGEMWMRGPTITKGYLRNTQANAETFTEDGWYKSGDILRRDSDGYFYIVDRKKEMLKYKGHQVAPAELEAVLMENPEVADVGVIGLKDEYTGDELPRAYVTPKNLNILQDIRLKFEFENRVESWFKGQASPIKYLRGGVRAISEIPKSGTGKVLRKDLRNMAERGGQKEKKASLSRL